MAPAATSPSAAVPSRNGVQQQIQRWDRWDAMLFLLGWPGLQYLATRSTDAEVSLRDGHVPARLQVPSPNVRGVKIVTRTSSIPGSSASPGSTTPGSPGTAGDASLRAAAHGK